MSDTHDSRCEAEWESGAMAYTPCRCAERAVEIQVQGALLLWAEPTTVGWPKGYMEWLCRCGEEVVVSWSASCALYDTEEPITPDGALTAQWQVECHAGHVLLLCHEVADDESADTYEPPTTLQVVRRLATPADIAAWQVWSAERVAKRATA